MGGPKCFPFCFTCESFRWWYGFDFLKHAVFFAWSRKWLHCPCKKASILKSFIVVCAAERSVRKTRSVHTRSCKWLHTKRSYEAKRLLGRNSQSTDSNDEALVSVQQVVKPTRPRRCVLYSFNSSYYSFPTRYMFPFPNKCMHFVISGTNYGYYLSSPLATSTFHTSSS